jgi:hypothetical protein
MRSHRPAKISLRFFLPYCYFFGRNGDIRYIPYKSMHRCQPKIEHAVCPLKLNVTHTCEIAIAVSAASVFWRSHLYQLNYFNVRRSHLKKKSAIAFIDSIDILDQAFEGVRTFQPMNDEQVRVLLAKTAEASSNGEFEPFKTSSIFDSTAQNPDWLGEESERIQQLMSA